MWFRRRNCAHTRAVFAQFLRTASLRTACAGATLPVLEFIRVYPFWFAIHTSGHPTHTTTTTVWLGCPEVQMQTQLGLPILLGLGRVEEQESEMRSISISEQKLQVSGEKGKE